MGRAEGLQQSCAGLTAKGAPEVEPRMYRPIFLWLNEAARRIASQLASAHPTEYPDEVFALDDARRQLVRALFDGALYSEGVCWSAPEAEDPSEPPPLPEPEKWEPIEAGWWSHKRYEPYMEPPLSALERSLLGQGTSMDEQAPVQKVVEGVHLLDLIMVWWEVDAFDPIGSEGEYPYMRIRVRCADIETHFGLRGPEPQPAVPELIINSVVSGENERRTDTDVVGKPKTPTRPPIVRDAVYAWLEASLQKKGPDWIRQKSNPKLADLYAITVASPVGVIGYVRKPIATWRKEHGLIWKQR
jgi:hypothetical protein